MQYKIGDHVVIEESNIEYVKKFAGRTGVIDRYNWRTTSDYPYSVRPDDWENEADGIWCKVKCLVEEVKENKVMKCKFNVGDKVRIRSTRGVGWNNAGEMDKYMGTIMTIREKDGLVLYKMEEDKHENNGYGWLWSADDFVEVVKENTTMKRKFKVGDKVIGNAENQYNITKKGWVGYVVELCDNDLIRVTDNELGEFGFVVHSDWFDLFVDTTHKIVITHDGKTTTATMYHDDTKTVATARCAPEDEFDFNVGAKLAMERLMNMVTPVTYGGFKVGDRVNNNDINGTVICIAKARYGEDDNAIGVEFDEANGMCHNCGGVELETGTEGTKDTSRWMKPSWLAHGEVIKPKYYNGKMVCIEKGHNDYTVGKIYEVVDGVFHTDCGNTIKDWGGAFKTFEDIVKYSSAKWIEIKE